MAHLPQIQVREPDVQTVKTSVQSKKIHGAPGEVFLSADQHKDDVVAIYLTEMARIPLLTAEQEQVLSRCAK